MAVLVTGAARGFGFELVHQHATAHSNNTVIAAVRKPSTALTTLATNHSNIHIVTFWTWIVRTVYVVVWLQWSGW